ncbi:MAG: MurR/RpiR family transcriptional regulator [Candidatus Limivicinus sp.]|jgi:DNA-binding MurR/RpiR family transcriptional regulator
MINERESVYERISSEYYTLTSSEKKVADYLLSRQQETQFLSISELARCCDVAEATVSRFCRSLGYGGYNAFKLAVANDSGRIRQGTDFLYGEVKEDDSLEDISKKIYGAEVDALNQTLELMDLDALKRAADLLGEARRVYCMGQGGSMIIASEAWHLFSTVCNKFSAVMDSHLQSITVATAEPEDVILFFSYSGSTKEMMHTIEVAKKRQLRIILVTRFPNSPGALLADIVLQCGSHENPLQSGSVPARIAQLYLLDVLFSEFTRRDMKKYLGIRSGIADALADKHV